jgi:acyl-CoA thioesterase-1
MRNLSIFYVLFGLLILTSCGETAKKDQEVVVEEQLPDEENSAINKVILFFGNSLTAGMGLDRENAFPAIIQEKIDSQGLEYQVINAGLSGETTASGKNRVSWVLNQNVDVFVLELGANDGLRGVPLEETRKNLQAIIDTVRAKNPETKILLTGMQIPPNMGKEYASGFRKIFPELAKKNDVYLVPFLLEDVAGIPELNQADGIHPTAEGQKILAENIWDVLEPIVKDKV